MEDIKDKLDKIKAALGDKGTNLVVYTADELFLWIQKQYDVGKDIKAIESHTSHDVRWNAQIHHLKGSLNDYFLRYGLLERQIKNKDVEQDMIEMVDTVRKEIIEIIDSLYEVVDPRFKRMRVQLEPIIEKLEKFEGDVKSPECLARIKAQQEIYAVMPQVDKIIPTSRNIQFNDWIHDFTRSIRGYVGGLYYLEEDLKNKVDHEKNQKRFQNIISFQGDLITSINSLNDITTDLKEKIGIDRLVEEIKAAFPNADINIENNLSILCSSCVYRSIIRELKENYRKYGTDGHISLTRENDMAVITFKNKKKEKDEEDSSTKKGLPIFEEYTKEVGGSFSCDYSTDDCVTIIRLPLYKENIKNRLDRIKAALGDNSEDLETYTTNQLSDWAKAQKRIEKDVDVVLTTPHEKNLQYDALIHQLSGYFSVYDKRREQIETNTYEQSGIVHLNKVRKNIIEIIDSLYEVANPRFKRMGVELEPIVKKLNTSNCDATNPELPNEMKLQKEILNDIHGTIQNGPKPYDVELSYHTWVHQLYSITLAYTTYLKCYEDGEECYGNLGELVTSIKVIKQRLIKFIESLDDITTNFREESRVRDIIEHIKETFSNAQIDIVDNPTILCSHRVSQSVIDELEENYRKYGTDGHISLTREDDMVVITLKNKKKEKDEKDSSTEKGLAIFEEYMKEVGGSFSCDYSTDDCVTIIRLPIYVKK